MYFEKHYQTLQFGNDSLHKKKHFLLHNPKSKTNFQILQCIKVFFMKKNNLYILLYTILKSIFKDKRGILIFMGVHKENKGLQKKSINGLITPDSFWAETVGGRPAGQPISTALSKTP